MMFKLGFIEMHVGLKSCTETIYKHPPKGHNENILINCEVRRMMDL
jgi:hypothetical protein